ncbi:MAG TPA: hypothetical protein VK756_07620 [Solirubrobacteraceae bacterium]|jgi:hypothetical protein|nr:hypothetical protein [Solirubrobacteraceae bacterium]
MSATVHSRPEHTGGPADMPTQSVRIRLDTGGLYEGAIRGDDPVEFEGRRLNRQADGSIFVSGLIKRQWPRARVISLQHVAPQRVERAA